MSELATSDNVFIHGFEISNFRSFRSTPVQFGPFEKVNVIIGANNSGKSNVLRFIRRIYPKILARQGISIEAADLPQLGAAPPDSHCILLRLPSLKVDIDKTLEKVARSSSPRPPEGYLRIALATDGRQFDLRPYQSAVGKYQQDIYRLWSRLNPGTSGGSIDAHWLPDILQRAINVSSQAREIVFVPAYRRLQSRLPNYADDYGQYEPGTDEKIIEKLAEFSQPPYDQQEKKKEFRRIVNFVRRVMNEPELELEIPHDRTTITVHLHGKALPIEALGTGIHELVLLAAKAVMQHDAVVCIEEPELHFHPELQRQFMQFIYEETSNQYFITTHSAHIMDAVPCSVHRVYLDEGTSKATRPISGNERRAVCHELGYRPSDLLQSNCVIWVEGPSDRIYVNHWLKAKAPELVEGLHYSIMFYGGALRSHLSAEEATFEDFIALLPINRFPVMIMDSDKRSAHSPINANKKRLREELEETGLCWITDGREIENYVPTATLQKAVKATHKKAVSLSSEDRRFGKPLDYLTDKSTAPVTEGFDKVAIAKAVCEKPADLGVLDLEKRVDQLVNFVRKANRLVGISAS